MSEKKIVDLGQYRKKKTQPRKDSGPSNKDDLSHEEKLLDLIHRPFIEHESVKELLTIFEEKEIEP